MKFKKKIYMQFVQVFSCITNVPFNTNNYLVKSVLFVYGLSNLWVTKVGFITIEINSLKVACQVKACQSVLILAKEEHN